MPGQLKTVSFMKPVVGERFRQDLRAHEHSRECEQVFVGLNFYCLRNRSDPSENCGAYRHPARSQKSAAPAKQKRAVNRISLKMKSFAKNLGSLTTVALNVDNAVAHNSNGRISIHRLRYPRQLLRRPPIIPVQERNDLSPAFRNARIKR